MHVGMCTIFQNPDKHLDDRSVYRNDLRLAELAEPLGFESVWTVEHHFTDYSDVPRSIAISNLHGRTDHQGQARHHGSGSTLA